MTKFLLIRHAVTDSVGIRLSGRTTGVSLNSVGREQAGRLAARLAGLHVSAVYSSPLDRAMETAAPIAGAHHLGVITADDFLELDFGQWTNKNIDDLRDDEQFRLFNSSRSTARIPGGETMAEAQLRIVKGVEKLCSPHPNETIAIVSHADMIKSAVAHFAGIHLDMMHRLEISPASVSIIELYDDNTARVVLLNDTGSINN